MKVLTKKAEEMTAFEIAQYIDDAVLDPAMPGETVRAKIREGIALKCWSVCVNPAYLSYTVEQCRGTDTRPCVVCDFPFGQGTTESRVAAAIDYIEKGAAEVDIVCNYNLIISGKPEECVADLKAVADACHERHTVLKAIIETDALTREQIALATDCVCRAGVDFVKSSTGYYNGEKFGATPEVCRIMLDAAQGRCLVKGSGCVRTRERICELINMGVDRIGAGCSSTPKLVSD